MIKYLSFCGKNEFLRVKLVGIDTWIKSLALICIFLHSIQDFILHFLDFGTKTRKKPRVFAVSRNFSKFRKVLFIQSQNSPKTIGFFGGTQKSLFFAYYYFTTSFMLLISSLFRGRSSYISKSIGVCSQNLISLFRGGSSCIRQVSFYLVLKFR